MLIFLLRNSREKLRTGGPSSWEYQETGRGGPKKYLLKMGIESSSSVAYLFRKVSLSTRSPTFGMFSLHPSIHPHSFFYSSRLLANSRRILSAIEKVRHINRRAASRRTTDHVVDTVITLLISHISISSSHFDLLIQLLEDTTRCSR